VKTISGVLCAGLALAATAASAKVEVRVAASGERTIIGESEIDTARRLSPSLLGVPDRELAGHIDRYARSHRLEPKLVQAVMQVESGYNRRALSNKGAIGLMQLMPDTARELRVQDPWDVEQNIRAGAEYLRQLVDRFQGRLHHALAGYNAGPGAVERWRGIPPYRETRDYVQRVLGLYRGPTLLALNKVVLHRDAHNRFVLSAAPR
jgi:soluble lytic murein transglycosylase-like protein